jgi:hypothetical protein
MYDIVIYYTNLNKYFPLKGLVLFFVKYIEIIAFDTDKFWAAKLAEGYTVTSLV